MNTGGIVVLGGPFPSTAMVFNHLRARFEVRRVLMERRPSRTQIFLRRRKKFGLANAVGQLAFRTLAAPMLSLATAARQQEIRNQFALDETPVPVDVLERLDSVNDSGCIRRLQELRPSVVVVNGTRLITPEVLQSIAAPFVNIHAGITPQYRGVHGAYWALAQRDRERCGVTLHLLDAGIDTGAVLAQSKIEPEARDNFASYPLLQIAAALPLLDQVIAQLLAERPIAAAAAASANRKSKLWSHPTLLEYLRLRARGVK